MTGSSLYRVMLPVLNGISFACACFEYREIQCTLSATGISFVVETRRSLTDIDDQISSLYIGDVYDFVVISSLILNLMIGEIG